MTCGRIFLEKINTLKNSYLVHKYISGMNWSTNSYLNPKDSYNWWSFRNLYFLYRLDWVRIATNPILFNIIESNQNAK